MAQRWFRSPDCVTATMVTWSLIAVGAAASPYAPAHAVGSTPVGFTPPLDTTATPKARGNPALQAQVQEAARDQVPRVPGIECLACGRLSSTGTSPICSMASQHWGCVDPAASGLRAVIWGAVSSVRNTDHHRQVQG